MTDLDELERKARAMQHAVQATPSEREQAAVILALIERVRASRSEGVNAAIRVIERGYFLHDDAPPARFAREVVAAIKRECQP